METLYSGSIPITKKHITYNYENQLPVLFVIIMKISIMKCLKALLTISILIYNFEVLSNNYWKEKIKFENNEKHESVNIKEKSITFFSK